MSTIIENFNWQNERILIADDDKYSYLLLNRTLQRTGATVLYAYDGTSALQILLQDKNITTVILDIIMPGISGVEVIKQCKNKLPNTLFFAYTAHSDYFSIPLCKDMGFETCFRKPILPIKVIKAINNYVKARENLTI